MSKAPTRPKGRPASDRKQISLKLKPEIDAALWELAQKTGSSRSEIVENAIVALVKTPPVRKGQVESGTQAFFRKWPNILYAVA